MAENQILNMLCRVGIYILLHSRKINDLSDEILLFLKDVIIEIINWTIGTV